MPGLDIPRDGSYTELPKNPTLEKIPGFTNDQTISVKADVIKFPAPIVSKARDSENTDEKIENHITAVVETMNANSVPQVITQSYDSGIG